MAVTTRIDVITGFLGAGKTTFLLRYCRWLHRQGIRFAVIELSGLFCGDDLMEILDTPGLRERLAPGMCLGVVDPLCLDVLREEDRAVLADELIWSGSVLLSKTQLCTSEELDMARTQLHSLLCPVRHRGWPALLQSGICAGLYGGLCHPCFPNGKKLRAVLHQRGKYRDLFQSDLL